jgi:hypothetical protein
LAEEADALAKKLKTKAARRKRYLTVEKPRLAALREQQQQEARARADASSLQHLERLFLQQLPTMDPGQQQFAMAVLDKLSSNAMAVYDKNVAVVAENAASVAKNAALADNAVKANERVAEYTQSATKEVYVASLLGTPIKLKPVPFAASVTATPNAVDPTAMVIDGQEDSDKKPAAQPTESPWKKLFAAKTPTHDSTASAKTLQSILQPATTMDKQSFDFGLVGTQAPVPFKFSAADASALRGTQASSSAKRMRSDEHDGSASNKSHKSEAPTTASLHHFSTSHGGFAVGIGGTIRRARKPDVRHPGASW